MKLLWSAILYTGLALGANAGPLQEQLSALKGDGLKALAVHATAKTIADVTLEGTDGPVPLGQDRGKIVVLNFWALWCAPCREEMPTLEALQNEFGGDDFQVVTVATGPNAPAGITKFFDEIGVRNLPKLRDPKSVLARAVGVFGLPATVILDRDGAEIARLIGPADWHSDDARAVIAALIAGDD